jgi:hypothetical protein
MQIYMRRLRSNPALMRCACGNASARIVGTEGICTKCDEIERQRAVLCQRALTGKKWMEAESEGYGARKWQQALEFWLPNPTPGWGSLEVLERMLNHRGTEARR